MSIEDTTIKHFQEHMIPIHFSFEKDGKIDDFIITSFVLSVDDRWFLVTAGHCIKQVEDLKENGYKLVGCQLIDYMGNGATDPFPVPFTSSYEGYSYTDEFGFDYGLIPLSEFFKQALLRNNIRALDEEVWDKQPPSVDYYRMLGVPEELVARDEEGISIRPLFLLVEAVDEKPSGFKAEIADDLFYGRIELDDSLESIRGMSGGPIFSFYTAENDKPKYWLAALQSSWLKQSGYIKACPTRLLGQIIRAMINGISPEEFAKGQT